MPLLICPNCGQSYNPRYIMYCARCGEPVPNERGKLPRPGPYDGFGSRGGLQGTKRAPRQVASSAASSAEPRPLTQAVQDIVLEYRNHLVDKPEDHETRFSLALAYLYAGQWQQAETELVAVAAALPDFADAHARLALCRARLGRLPEALAAARQAVQLEPESPRYRSLVEQLERAGANAG
jgi:tetratricopeptide (TPR) repeat protein